VSTSTHLQRVLAVIFHLKKDADDRALGQQRCGGAGDGPLWVHGVSVCVVMVVRRGTC